MLNQTIQLILRVGYRKFNKCQHLSETKITQNQIYVNITIQLQKSNFKNRIQEYQICNQEFLKKRILLRLEEYFSEKQDA